MITAHAPAAEPPVRDLHIRYHTDLAGLEVALAAGLLDEWRQLAEDDPKSSLFQAPGWPLAWYRTSAASFAPFVIEVRSDGRLVGLVPMSVERATGEFDFAGRSSADYRDILALPAHRGEVVAALVAAYRVGGYRNVLSVGWMDPASDTPELLASVCREAGLPVTSRTHPCWRWFPPPPAKPNGHKFLNWYKKHGTVRFEVIQTMEQWQSFREEYFLHHSLRQLQTGRGQAFDDPARRAFYDELFASPDVQSHVTAFYAGERLVAAHFGKVWRNVLHLGPPAIRLEDEQRSPAVVLLSWIIQNAESLGLAAFDMTIGDTDFKRRLGNRRFELTTVDVYPSQRAFVKARAVRGTVESVKAVVTRLGGASAWKARVLPLAERAGFALERLRERGVVRSIVLGAQALAHRVYERRVGLVFTVRPGAFITHSPKLAPGESWEVHDNRPEDLLAWNGASVGTAAIIGQVARNYGRTRSANRTLHTVLVNGRLAGWGFSYVPETDCELTETPGVRLQFEAGAVSLYDFHTIPEFRGRRLYQALLAEIVRRRFAEGAQVAYIAVLEANTASRVAIERVGFTVRYRNVSQGIFSGRIVTADRRASQP
jgi:CelD/BcsL family acetyltransferase involved in cellulose biosynthesis